MTVKLPYSFTDGQRAFAARLMANFNALSGALNNVSVAGLATADIETTLNTMKKLIDDLSGLTGGKVTANQAGNAGQILFTDGQSFQAKLNNNSLKGQDGQCCLDRLYYFRVDPGNGHLYVGVPDGVGKPPVSIDGNGHLIYRID
ncbi:MAG: hypothetical protein RRY35_08155 [Clostridiales bacterium]